ncbi:MAG: hypothetical protein Q9P01_17605 [Anaerolineae bacterium]|nr:hypothetical protein [Anaerolineae bacterium]MDQ7036573.1 hypothetical protein [Anaerolineae bacterium]
MSKPSQLATVFWQFGQQLAQLPRDLLPRPSIYRHEFRAVF